MRTNDLSRLLSVLPLVLTPLFLVLFLGWLGDERGWQSPWLWPALACGAALIVFAGRYLFLD
jgi:hypothetical protein